MLISEWASKGLLDNSVIKTLWDYFIKRIPVSDNQSHAALHILSLAAIGRRTIISINIELVSQVVFGLTPEPRGLNNLLLVKTACDILALMGMEKQVVTDKKPPFTLSPENEIWRNIFKILEENFEKPVRFYNKAQTAAINLVFKICSQPLGIVEEFTTNITKKFNEKGDNVLRYLVVRVVHLYGEVAIRLLNFLDEKVYKELKRRHYIREENKQTKNKKKIVKKKPAKVECSRSVNHSVLNDSTVTVRAFFIIYVTLMSKLITVCNSLSLQNYIYFHVFKVTVTFNESNLFLLLLVHIIFSLAQEHLQKTLNHLICKSNSNID